MLIYIRNLILLIAAQTILITFGLNYTLVPRLQIPEFTMAEVFVYCSIISIVSHNFKYFVFIQSMDAFKKILAGMASISYSVGTNTLIKLQDIDNNTKGKNDETGQNKNS